MINNKKEQRALASTLFVVYMLALFWSILFKLQFSIPVMERGRVLNLIPLLGSFDDDGALLFSEIRINILVFVPLGIYLCVLKKNWSFAKKAFSAFLLSFGFEAAQYVFVIGRADITDVLSNTLGGIIGIGVYALLLPLMKEKTDRVINALAAVLTILASLLVITLLVTHRWVRFQ